MKKKNKYIWFVFIVLTNIFGLYKLIPFGSALYSLDFMFVMALILAFFLLLNSIYSRHGIFKKPLFYQIGCWLMVLTVVEVLYTFINFKQPIYYACKESLYYIIPIVLYFSVSQYSDKLEVNEILDIVVKVSIISSSVAIVVILIYSITGMNLFNIISNTENIRNGSVRFGVGSLVVFPAIVISVTKVMNKESNKLDCLNIFLGLIQVIFVNKTRANIIYMIMVILISILNTKKTNKLLRILIITVIICGGVIGFLSTESISAGMNTYINGDISIMARLEEIEFYLREFIKHPILGMGFLTGDKSVYNWQLVGGYNPAIYYYREDVGYVGFLNKFGVLGMIWLIYYFRLYFLRIKGDSLESKICRNLMVYLIISSISLNVMDPQRTMYLFIVLFIGEMAIKDKRKRECT